MATVIQVRKYFDHFNLPQPPLPENLADFVNCELLITETRHTDGKRTGQIRFIRANRDVCYEQEWTISPG